MAAHFRHVRGRFTSLCLQQQNSKQVQVWLTRDGVTAGRRHFSHRSLDGLVSTCTTTQPVNNGAATHRNPRGGPLLCRHRGGSASHKSLLQAQLLFGSTTPVRWNSSATTSATGVTPDVSQVLKELQTHYPEGYIPEPPAIQLTDVDPAVSALNALGEPTLKALGLASNWTPAGWYQNLLELVHVELDLPWWQCIAASVLCVRILIFPFLLKGMRAGIVVHNNAPATRHAMKRQQEAIADGNMIAAGIEMEKVEKNAKDTFKMMYGLPAQLFAFASVFTGLRNMANLPVESFTTGGALWFTDLTVPDPTYGLSIITGATLFVVMELGAEGISNSAMSRNMRIVMRCMPLGLVCFTSYFPSALLCYWCTSNIISLTQAAILKIPAVRKKLNIPIRIKHPKDAFPEQGTFLEQFRERRQAAYSLSTNEQRLAEDRKNFQRAGMGPVPKTYPLPEEREKSLRAKMRSQKR